MLNEKEIAAYTADLLADGEDFSYGSAVNDIMVMVWEDNHDPVDEFRENGYYTKMRDLVVSGKVSGTFYRGVDNINQTDYTDRISSWTANPDTALKFTSEEDPIVLRCTFVNHPGLMLKNSREEEFIMGEMHVTSCTRNGDYYDITIV